MLKFMKQMFTWWSGNTIGTRFFTWCHGKRVGEDEFGNVYYEGSRHKDGYTRRWVIYKNISDASTIPSGWHGWIHYRTDTPPNVDNYVAKDWEKPHIPNLTGTSAAYTPKGSIANHGNRPHVVGDYAAWHPENH